MPEQLFQEPGIRRSRALPYELHVQSRIQAGQLKLALSFENPGRMGAVFHVYDRLHLDRTPRRYTVEAGKSLQDEWELTTDRGRYDLWIYGPNGFVREFRGALSPNPRSTAQIELRYDTTQLAVELIATNHGPEKMTLLIKANAYRTDGPWSLSLSPGKRISQRWSVTASHRWYDFTVQSESMVQRFAGRLENGASGFSDPAV